MILYTSTDLSVKPYASIFRAEQASSSSETSVNFYYIARRSIPENSILRIHGRENFKSLLVLQPVTSDSN
jgi:hypothetical protein